MYGAIHYVLIPQVSIHSAFPFDGLWQIDRPDGTRTHVCVSNFRFTCDGNTHTLILDTITELDVRVGVTWIDRSSPDSLEKQLTTSSKSAKWDFETHF